MFDSIKELFNFKPKPYEIKGWAKPPREFCVPPLDVEIASIEYRDVIKIVNSLLNNNTFYSTLDTRKEKREIEGISPTIISPFETKGLLEIQLSEKVEKLEKENIELKEEVKRLNDLVEYWKIAKNADEDETTTVYLGDGSTYEERIVRRRN